MVIFFHKRTHSFDSFYLDYNFEEDDESVYLTLEINKGLQVTYYQMIYFKSQSLESLE